MDKGHLSTDKMLLTMEKKLTAIYSRANKEVTEKMKEYLDGLKGKESEMLDAIKAAKTSEEKKKAKDAYKAFMENATVKNAQFNALAKSMAENLKNVNQTAVAYVNGQLPRVYSLNYNAVGGDIASKVKGYSFDMVDASTVKSLATKDKTLLPYKTVDGKKDVRWNTRAVNSEVLQGILQGESIPNISKRLTNVTEMNLSSAIRNARTSTTCAENRGRMDSYHRAEEMGIEIRKVWMATDDGRTREEHAELDGQERDIDEPFENSLGEIMYPGDPDADPANVYNCFVPGTKIASDSEIIRGYKHEYNGRLVTVKTAGGVNFTCTPNHPIMTLRGWVPAERLQDGDNLLVTSVSKNGSLRVNPDVDHAFPSIDAIHKTLDMSGGKRTTSMAVNFHGDVPTSDVEIITQERFLRIGRNANGRDSVNEILFKRSNKSLLCECSFMKHIRGVFKATFGFIRSACKTLPILWGRLRHSEKHGLRPVALLYSGRVKPLDDDVSGNAKLISECLDGFSGIVFADNVVSVDVCSGTSNVYNLQTENGYYFVNSNTSQNAQKGNGIFAIAKNCRCTLVTRIIGFRR